MADSKDQPQALPQVPPEGTSLVIVRTKEGGLREMIRSEKGTFVKKSKPLIPTIEFTRKERKILYGPNKDKEGMTEHEVSFRNILRISQLETSDPKLAMAVVKAYEIVMRRALGKEASSEQDLDRITTQPVKTIIVVSPDLMNPKVVDADQAVVKPKQPSFAEVIGVITNEKKK
jgi:hypothetical protein